MGEACCRRSSIIPDIEFTSPEHCEDFIIDKKRSSLDSALLQELLNKYSMNFSVIIQIQSWYRGCIARKQYTISPINSRTIINYISSSLKSNELVVRRIEEKLGPFIVIWSLEEVKKQNLELRKVVIEEDNVIYHGYWNKDNIKEGYGQELFSNGSKYEGFWVNGEFHGQGRFIYENGDYFFGEWKDGKTDGKGTFISTEGTKYIGEWKNNVHHGYGNFYILNIGIETWEDGSQFEGNYIDGRKEGKGKFLWMDGSFYEGDFNDNKLEGNGTYKWQDGRIYTGQWKDSQMQGIGKFIFPDGKVYTGEMKNDHRHGIGKMEW